MAGMYECFTDKARKVMQFANGEARRLTHDYVGTEHILLGLVKEGSGVAANVLKNLDIDLRKIRLEVEKIVQSGPEDPVSLTTLRETPRAKKVIEYAVAEARHLNHNWVGTEHLLLGLLREEEGVAAQVLMNLGLKLQHVRDEVLNLLGWSPAVPIRRQPAESAAPEVEDFPAEVRQAAADLDAEIERFTLAKEAAVAEQDFEKAAHLRDEADRRRRRRWTLLPGWVSANPIEPSWLSGNDAAVLKIARAIAAAHRWQDLPALADALEQVGCTEPEVLNHCRQPGEHGRRCWVVDWLLGQV
jgi:ATP-dependent Clp protease ATP-binding subunit ClpA